MGIDRREGKHHSLASPSYDPAMSRRSLRTFISCLTLGALFACGGGSGSPKSAATEDALKDAVAEFGDAVLAGETSKAYAYFTKECRETVPKAEFAVMTQMGLAFLEGFADTKASDLRTGNVEIQNFTETSAEARAEIRDKNGDLFSDANSEDWSPWVYEDGGWHTSDCGDYQEGFEFDESGDIQIDAFSYPPCSDLVDGQPVPAEFESDGELDITCEDGDDIFFGFATSCFSSTREYASNEIGYAFLDEGVFRAGEVRGCSPPCSDLVDGQPVPSTFDDDSAAGFNLNCENAAGEESWSFEWECFDSPRVYVQGDEGHAFADDRIYIAGDPEYC